MITTTLNEVPGRTISEVLGLVQGVEVQGLTVSERMMGEVGTAMGGSNAPYTRVAGQARETATSKMIDQAEQMKAHAIIGVRYETSPFAPGLAEVVAYGTAVKLK